jgi:hypothetical protein
MKGGSAMRFDIFSLLPEVMQTYLSQRIGTAQRMTNHMVVGVGW